MGWDIEDTMREERYRQRRYELTLAERREAIDRRLEKLGILPRARRLPRAVDEDWPGVKSGRIVRYFGPDSTDIWIRSVRVHKIGRGVPGYLHAWAPADCLRDWQQHAQSLAQPCAF